MEEFHVNLQEIEAAQDKFKAKIDAMRASADAIDGIMQSQGGAPGGADSINSVQGMLDALKRLEEAVKTMPDEVHGELSGIGSPGSVDDSHIDAEGGQDHSDSGLGGQGSNNNSGNNNSGGHGGGKPEDHPGGGHGGGKPEDHPGGGNSGMNPNSPESQTGDPAETPSDTVTDPATGEPIGPELPDGDGEENGADTDAGTIFTMPYGMGQQNQNNEEEEEEEEEPVYVSAANKAVKQALDEKSVLLASAQENVQAMQAELNEKQDRLSRLEASFVGNYDQKLADDINQLRAEVAALNANLTNDLALVESLQVEVDSLAKRYSYIDLPAGANLEKIQALEGGRTSQWILDATRNEDNSINCVNYVCNRMPIPGELPLNAHMWDDQATKFATELGIKIGDVPVEGAIIVMEPEHSYGHDVYGHVMYVEKVENGIVWVTDNNYPDKPVRLDHLTNELSGPFIKYLYCPWQVVV
jgi:surface antigen